MHFISLFFRGYRVFTRFAIVLIIYLVVISCGSKGLVSPYKQPQGKPKPCKCGTRKNPWASKSFMVDPLCHSNNQAFSNCCISALNSSEEKLLNSI